MTTTYETATVNRVAGYYERPLPQLPEHPHDRQDLLADCVLQAVVTMRSLLSSGDRALSFKAAEAILALEQTRIRHGTQVSGCRQKLQPKWEEHQEMKECFEDAGPPREPTAQDLEEAAFKQHAKEVRDELQKLEENKPAKDREKVTMKAGADFVRGRLKNWGVSATSIPARTFWKEWIVRDLRRGKPLEDDEYLPK
jgi:hypothetical protein